MTSNPVEYLLKVRAAESSYLSYLQLRYPDRQFPPFQLQLIDTLDKLEKGTLGTQNLLITMPPRHGKSEYGTVNFPTYYMGRDPRRYVMSSSYNAILAADFGKQARNISEERLTAQIFPTMRVSPDSRASDVWRTTQNGAYFGVGLDGTTSGRPANCLIVDDPFKSREDADSATMRNKVWNFYTSALSTRLQPTADNKPPIQIVILTRWHPDDLAGRLMQTEDWKNGLWTHINFEARSGNPPAALWPERFNLDWLSRREALNPREFASLYQQTPYVQGGNLIHDDWWRYYEPNDPNAYVCTAVAVDSAHKLKSHNDPSVALVGGLTRDGDIHLLDILRARLEFPELKQRLIQLNTKYRSRQLRGFYIEDRASGQSLIQELKRESGVPVIPYKVTHDKIARVSAILPHLEAGRVFLPNYSPWTTDFKRECAEFPSSKHDDQVDALAILIDVLSKMHVTPETWNADIPLAPSLDTYGKSLRQQLMPNSSQFPGWGIGTTQSTIRR
jgi:predicted phage terminase large subunit-like protein